MEINYLKLLIEYAEGNNISLNFNGRFNIIYEYILYFQFKSKYSVSNK